jgi:PPE-repeat protein
MKTYIASLLRHALTGLTGLGTFLAAKGLIATDEVAAANAAGVSLADALPVVISIVLARLAITLLGKIFPGEGTGVNGTEGSGGSLPAIGLLIMAAGFGSSLPSCTPTQIEAFRNILIEFRVDGPQQSSWAYSSKHGVEIMARMPDRKSGK